MITLGDPFAQFSRARTLVGEAFTLDLRSRCCFDLTAIRFYLYSHLLRYQQPDGDGYEGDPAYPIGIERHVRMGRCRVQIKIIFLHILAVIALAAGEAEEAFFEDRIAAVPEGQGETDELMLV